MEWKRSDTALLVFVLVLLAGMAIVLPYAALGTVVGVLIVLGIITLAQVLSTEAKVSVTVPMVHSSGKS